MSAYPAPPGLSNTSASSNSSSLPSRPPPSASRPQGFKPAFQSSASTYGNRNGGSGAQGFTGFAPRALGNANGSYHNPNTISSGSHPSSTYATRPAYNADNYSQAHSQHDGYYQQGHNDAYAQQAQPQIRNPFAPPTATISRAPAGAGANNYHGQSNYDPDMEAQIAQWQSAYMPKDDSKAAQRTVTQPAPVANSAPTVTSGKISSDAKPAAAGGEKPFTVQRTGGGQKWNDNTLLEWDPAHFRIFVGNLAGEVTDDTLLKAFAKYPSVQKARVIRDKTTTKSKGYGFVSFSDGDDYFKAARDMQNKYIGSHPVKIKKSTTEIKPTVQRNNNRHHKGNKLGNRGAEHSANGVLGPTGGGISKKASKTKGGLKILG